MELPSAPGLEAERQHSGWAARKDLKGKGVVAITSLGVEVTLPPRVLISLDSVKSPGGHLCAEMDLCWEELWELSGGGL